MTNRHQVEHKTTPRSTSAPRTSNIWNTPLHHPPSIHAIRSAVPLSRKSFSEAVFSRLPHSVGQFPVLPTSDEFVPEVAASSSQLPVGFDRRYRQHLDSFWTHQNLLPLRHRLTNITTSSPPRFSWQKTAQGFDVGQPEVDGTSGTPLSTVAAGNTDEAAVAPHENFVTPGANRGAVEDSGIASRPRYRRRRCLSRRSPSKRCRFSDEEDPELPGFLLPVFDNAVTANDDDVSSSLSSGGRGDEELDIDGRNDIISRNDDSSSGLPTSDSAYSDVDDQLQQTQHG